MPSISTTARRKFRNRIVRASKKRSFRCIAREDYPMTRQDGKRIVKAGTLNRIVRDKDYFPKDELILLAFGLIKPRKQHPKPISEMSSDELLRALRDRRPLPPINYSQRSMDNFITACRRASKQRRSAS